MRFLFLHTRVNAWRGRDSCSSSGSGRKKGCRRGSRERAADIDDGNDDARGLDERSTSTSTTDHRHHHLCLYLLRSGRRRRGRRRGPLRRAGARTALGRPEQHVSVFGLFVFLVSSSFLFLFLTQLCTTKTTTVSAASAPRAKSSPPRPTPPRGPVRPRRQLYRRLPSAFRRPRRT